MLEAMDNERKTLLMAQAQAAADIDWVNALAAKPELLAEYLKDSATKSVWLNGWCMGAVWGIETTNTILTGDK